MAAAWVSASSRVIEPSSRPSVAAKPLLVVARKAPKRDAKPLSPSRIAALLRTVAQTSAYLERRQVGGIYRYFSPAAPGQVMRDVVRSFVEKTLGGSVSPFVTYLTEEAEVSDGQLAELEELVAKLQSQRKEEA